MKLLRRIMREEDGQTLLLGLGLVTIILALLLVIASATAIYLDLKHLTSLADSAAAAGAATLDDSAYFDNEEGGPGARTSGTAHAAAAQDLALQEPNGGLSQVVVASATVEGETVSVTLTARSQPPFLPWGIIPADGFALTATGSAQAVTTR